MKSLLEEGSTCLCGARRQVGVDMPPLPDAVWNGIGLLLLTDLPTFSGTFSETEATLSACGHAQAGWSIPENEPTTTAAEPRNGTIRWYDPITGRWLSKDPIGISGGLNQYVFCDNNPINVVDPSGLEPLSGKAFVSGGSFALATRDTRVANQGRYNFIQLRSPTGQGGWVIDARNVLGTALRGGMDAINVPSDRPYYFDDGCENFKKYQDLLFENLGLARHGFSRGQTTVFADGPSYPNQTFVLFGVVKGESGATWEYAWKWKIENGRAIAGQQMTDVELIEQLWGVVMKQAPNKGLKK